MQNRKFSNKICLIYEDGFGVKRKSGTLLPVRQLWP